MDLIKAYDEKFKYIAFLDIDGVFNNQYFHGEYKFYKESVDFINTLYDKYGIEIVISSTWRHGYTFAFLQKVFKENGIKAPVTNKTYVCFSEVEKPRCGAISLNDLMNMTEDELQLKSIFRRENEIKQWLRIFDAEHYIIIDDFKMYDDKLSNHQILTYNWGDNEKDLGLRIKYMPKAEEILKL